MLEKNLQSETAHDANILEFGVPMLLDKILLSLHYDSLEGVSYLSSTILVLYSHKEIIEFYPFKGIKKLIPTIMKCKKVGIKKISNIYTISHHTMLV